MSDLEKSSNNSNERDSGLSLCFSQIAPDKLSLPKELYSDQVTAGEGSLALYLPLIVGRLAGSYIIIDGCKRFKALTALGRDSLSCGIIEPELDPVKMGLLRIELNRGRQLHTREKLLFIRWLKSNLDPNSWRGKCAKLALAPGELHEYEQLAECGAHLMDAVMEGVLDPAVAPELQHLSETDGSALIGLFRSLPFSRQMQRELAEWIHEIAYLQKTPLPEFLRSENVAGTITDRRLNNPQKAARIHETVHAIRFPLYTKVKKAWLDHSRKTNPDPSRVTFQASPAFEKNSLEVRIRVSDGPSMHTIAQKLASVDLNTWQKLIDPTAIPITNDQPAE